MDAFTYVKQRQILWAQRCGIALEGSEAVRGERAYTLKIEDNLFRPLSDGGRQDYEQGDGGELRGKIRAVHSSSAVACNLFDYWRQIDQPHVIAEACGIPAAGIESLRFEAKLPVCQPVDRQVFPHDPNLDVLIRYGTRSRTRATGIEVKFTEAYSTREHGGLKSAFLDRPACWEGIPACRKFATTLCPTDHHFQHLHPAQLVKHILGLKHAFGPSGFRLLYLWYDVPFDQGTEHRREIAQFTEVAKADGIDFQAITHQEVILNLARRRRSEHMAYVDYMADRYL